MTAKPSVTTQSSSSSPQSLNRWIARQIAPRARVQVRLRGNILHVLCETPQALHRAGAISRLVDALLEAPSGIGIITGPYPQVYQLYVYSRQVGHTKPAWTAPLYLNRLERHKAQLQAQSTESLRIATSPVAHPPHQGDALAGGLQDDTTTALVISQMSLARQGDPKAIAWYLSEVLSTLDVGVWVSIRAVPGTATVPQEATAVETKQPPSDTLVAEDVPRLWILCEAAYSPDPLMIAEPVTKRLRQLALQRFKDAVIVIQVYGENRPDWSLRVDLTPPEEMLQEWGRWGDRPAIVRLMNQAVSSCAAQVEAEQKDESLHFVIQTIAGKASGAPDETQVMAAIAPLLERLAPQGFQRAMVYGQAHQAKTPTWVRCLNLPALEHAALAVATTTLAQQGDLPALAYVLTRLLNPDLDVQLATGGIRVQLLQRDALLHIMADAPRCPTRRQIVMPVLRLLQDLDLQDISGVRIYGRRAGQQRPAWSYGRDLQERERLIPKAEPTFAASDAYVGDLLNAPQETVLHPDVPPAGEAAIAQTPQQGLERLREWLLQTQVFVSQHDLPRTPPPLSAGDRRDTFRVSLVWGLVGLVLTLLIDWQLGQRLATIARSTTAAFSPQDTTETPTADRRQATTTDISDRESRQGSSAWAAPLSDPSTPPSPSQKAASPQIPPSPYPTFRSQQLDEKIQLYHQHLQASGPPDVLIMGSSRALRGVDPAALGQELAALGLGQLNIFNFGINGATAQVVDLTLRRILEAHQLPRLIIWADGARAFNSGRVDVTYNAIATSQGYKTLEQRAADRESQAATAIPTDEALPAEPQSVGETLRDSYQDLDQTLSHQLGQWSAVYGDREQVKTLLRDRVLISLLSPIQRAFQPAQPSQTTSDLPIPDGSRIDADGFLALDMEFNPATYYQLYARVAGTYDSDYESFHLEGNQLEAFQRLLGYTQAQNIPLIFVNTPLTDEYLDTYRMTAEADFRQLMFRLSATEEAFIFRDLGQLWTNQYDYFSDPSHLNRHGAYQVSHRLAHDPMIPWPRTLETPVPETGTAP